MGQLIMDTWSAQALHANTAIAFTIALQSMPRVAITNVGYQIHKPDADLAALKQQQAQVSKPEQPQKLAPVAVSADEKKNVIESPDEVL